MPSRPVTSLVPLPGAADVVVIGAGIMGLSIAYELARLRAKRSIVVLERSIVVLERSASR